MYLLRRARPPDHPGRGGGSGCLVRTSNDSTMIYGYARVPTDGQSVAAQFAALRNHGAGKVFREVASGSQDGAPSFIVSSASSTPATC